MKGLGLGDRSLRIHSRFLRLLSAYASGHHSETLNHPGIAVDDVADRGEVAAVW